MIKPEDVDSAELKTILEASKSLRNPPAFRCSVHGFHTPDEVRVRQVMKFQPSDKAMVSRNLPGCKEKTCGEVLSVVPMWAKCPSCGKELGADRAMAYFTEEDQPDDGWRYEEPPGMWLHCDITFGWSWRRLLSFLNPTRWFHGRRRWRSDNKTNAEAQPE